MYSIQQCFSVTVRHCRIYVNFSMICKINIQISSEWRRLVSSFKTGQVPLILNLVPQTEFLQPAHLGINYLKQQSTITTHGELLIFSNKNNYYTSPVCFTNIIKTCRNLTHKFIYRFVFQSQVVNLYLENMTV